MQKQKNASKQKREPFTRLTVFERARIELRYNEGMSLRRIGRELKRPASTISREISEYKSKKLGCYKADVAHGKALKKRESIGKRPRLKNEIIENYVIEKMKIGWSPEQISIRLPMEKKGSSVSPEAIYQYVYAQIQKGGFNAKKGCEDLRIYLPRRHTRRQHKGFRQARKLYRLELPSIEGRPKIVDKRKELGHWEDDCIVSRESAVRLKTMNERVSGIILIRKMKDGTILESNRAVTSCMNTIPSPFRKTLTRDRGTENMGYLAIEKEFRMQCYFAHAYCSQERGSNENGNGLIRRMYPKKTDFAMVTDEALSNLEYLLNSRPRKRLGGKTPYEVFYERTGVALEC